MNRTVNVAPPSRVPRKAVKDLSEGSRIHIEGCADFEASVPSTRRAQTGSGISARDCNFTGREPRQVNVRIVVRVGPDNLRSQIHRRIGGWVGQVGIGETRRRWISEGADVVLGP